ncbi:MAG: hypothetical protein H7A25_20480 [Leptospiraceae bacterium]|nr:hypothetical protein [Leptospiraceae bacterium]MCP5502284.1 hypothetical protein [Leptospiraceae bacterium]
MKKLLILILSFLFTVSAFAQSKGGKKGPVQRKTQSRVMEISINQNKLEKQDNTYVYSPDQGRMTQHYTYYVFPADNLLKIVGKKNLKKDFKVKVIIEKTTSKTSKPSDPNMPQPDGGFRHTYNYCRAIKLISVE